MTNSNIGAIVLAAGKGTRMKSDLPKTMMPLGGKPMIRHILDSMEAINADKVVVVIAPDGDLVKKEVSPVETCVQERQLGTGSAVLSAKNVMSGFDGDILVIFGDHPITTPKTFLNMVNKRRDEGAAVVVLGFRPEDAARYGRLKMKDGELEKIVEFKDATDEEKAINLCNSGIMCFDGKVMFDLLDKIGNDNAAGEYYLTDAIQIAREKGLKCAVVECDAEEVGGANTLEELALLEQYLLKRQGK